MSYDHDGAEYEDEEIDSHDRQRTSLWSRFLDRFTHDGDDDAYYEDASDAHAGQAPQIAPQPQRNPAQPPPPRPSTVVNGTPQFAVESSGVARVNGPTRMAGGALNPMRRPTTVSPMRVERERTHSVTVRRTVQSFEDVRRAVDGLREGIQQIVNIEQTPPDVAERLIDFLNGATYAMDGSVEKIGTQVYLFTPSTITIDVEDKTKLTVSKPFFDRE